MKQLFTLSVLLFSFFQIAFSQQILLDPSFGDNGIVKTDMGSPFNYSNIGKQVLVQSDGSIYMVFEGNGPSGFGISYPTMIAKILSNGAADLSYGHNGFSVPLPIFSSHAAMQADGKIIVAGSVSNPDQYYNETDFAVARLNTDGSLDNSFGENGIQIVDMKQYDNITSVAIQSDGKIVVAGNTNTNTSTAPTYDPSQRIPIVLFRFTQDGSLDNTFNGNRIIAYTNGSAYSIAIGGDGKIVVAGRVGDKASVIRYNQDGSFDPGFDGSWLSIMGFTSSDEINSIAIQNDGKIVAAGYKKNGNTYDFAVVRFTSDGSPDATFNENGRQLTDFGGANDTSICVAIQSDGKIVLAGYSSSGGNTNFAICRYNSDGSLDNTFNTNGKQTTDFGSASGYANSLGVQADGKLVVLGYKNDGVKSEVAAARYSADGSLDNTFGENGTLVHYIEQGNTHFTSTVIQDDGKIVAAGSTWNGSNYDFSFVRYNTNGSLDNTFATAGKQITDFDNTGDVANAMTIQNDGKFLLAGYAGDNFAIARYNTDGSLDNTFGVNGKQVSVFGSSEFAASIRVQSDGKIIVGVKSTLARYNANGSPDLSFGQGGKIVLNLICDDIAIQSDNKIVVVTSVAGSTSFAQSDGLQVARYNVDGSADNTFGYNGVQYVRNDDCCISTRFVGKSVRILGDGKIMIGGYKVLTYRGTSSSFLLIKLGTDGTPDNTFGDNGVLIPSNVGSLNYATSMVIEGDGKMILGGYSYNGSSNNFTIRRFNADGSPDITFSDDGIEITNASVANNTIADIALSDEMLYAVGYGQYPGNLGVVARYLLPSGGPLPVTLTDFTSALKNNRTLLQWQTASEYHLSHFTIERSVDGNNFSSLSDVVAYGNSSTKISYSAIDYEPLQGTNYYRLKLVDADGRFTYSKIATVNNNSQFSIRISPNPASNILFLQATGNTEKVNYQIINIEGRKLKEATIVLGNNTLYPINISGLSKGNYMINIQTKTGKESLRFIKD